MLGLVKGSIGVDIMQIHFAQAKRMEMGYLRENNMSTTLGFLWCLASHTYIVSS